MPLPAVMFLSFAFLLLIRVPLAFSLGIASLITMFLAKIPLASLAHTYFTAVDNFAFMAIPLFVFAGSLMERGGISQRLIDIADILFGKMSGGLGLVTIATSMFFAALTGCGNTATAAVGALMIPSMIRRGYGPAFSGAVTAIGGTMGTLIPPSLTLIVYGILADVSIARLFLAAMVPGIILGILLMINTYIVARRKGYKGSETRFNLRNLLKAINRGKWALVAPVIILGGIYGGFITPTESAVIAVVYGFVVGAFIHRELDLPTFIECLKSSVEVTGVVGIIWGTALGFGELISYFEIPQQLSHFMMGITTNATGLLIIISIWETFIGTWMNTMAQIVIMTPIYLQIIGAVGIDPVVFGIIFVLNCEEGFVTPPLGTSLFVAMPIAKVGLGEISYATLPLLISLWVTTGIVIVFRDIPLWLPNLIMGAG